MTADSEQSPVRADMRVKRAAKQVAQSYLQDVSAMVYKANDPTVKKFSSSVLKNAHKEINGR